MSLKKVVVVAFVSLMLLFLFNSLAMAWDWPQKYNEHPWEEVKRALPGHDSWSPLFEHAWEEVKRPWPNDPNAEHPWEEVKRYWPNEAHSWGDE